ncbi:MAG TPA: hypothetical protein VGX78_05275 [Pirellulales bacterium]|nr:hypothetical protein [Pirellulales bacterium]
MTIKFRCPNGHKLRLEEKDVGKKGTCPKCHVHFTLPKPQPRREVSDTSILTLLGDQKSDESMIVKTPAPGARAAQVKVCVKCRATISAAYQICPKCRTYLPLEVLPNAW